MEHTFQAFQKTRAFTYALSLMALSDEYEAGRLSRSERDQAVWAVWTGVEASGLQAEVLRLIQTPAGRV